MYVVVIPTMCTVVFSSTVSQCIECDCENDRTAFIIGGTVAATGLLVVTVIVILFIVLKCHGGNHFTASRKRCIK